MPCSAAACATRVEGVAADPPCTPARPPPPPLLCAVAAADPATGRACPGTAAPAVSAARVRQAVFAELNPRGPTVASLYIGSSFNKTRISQATSAVANLVTLPCAGTL